MSADIRPIDPPGTVSGVPIGRIVALFSPLVATIAGALATWLFTHFPGLHVFGSSDDTAKLLVEGFIWLLTAGITYAAHHKWLDGLSKWERGVVSDYPGDNSGVMGLPGDLNDDTGLPDELNAGEPSQADLALPVSPDIDRSGGGTGE